MDVRALEHFVAVAEELNVTRAAARTHSAQSTVSAAISSLEREVGAKLFERTTRSVTLTDVGTRVLVEARAALAAVGRMYDEARDDGAGLRGRVRLGTFAALDLFDLPGLLRDFRTVHPSVDLSLTTSPSGASGLREDLLRGRVDIAFSALAPRPDLARTELLTAPYLAFLPPDHRLADRPRLRLVDLADEDWIETPVGFGSRIAVEAALESAGVARRLVIETSDLASALQFVRAGHGVALLPDLLPHGDCVGVTLADGPGDWVLAAETRRTPALGAAAQALLESLGERAASLGGPSTRWR